MKLTFILRYTTLLLPILFFTFFNTTQLKAQQDNLRGDYHLSYDFCRGRVIIDLWYLETFANGNHDYVKEFKPYYVNSSGQKILILDFVNFVHPGYTPGGAFDGYSSSWGAFNGNLVVATDHGGVPPASGFAAPQGSHFIRFYWVNPPQDLLNNQLKFEPTIKYYDNGDNTPTINKSLLPTDYKAPDKPTDIEVVNDECNQVTIKWTHPTIACPVIKFVRIYRDGVALPDQVPPNVSFTDTGLEAGKTYKYTLRSGYYSQDHSVAIFSEPTFAVNGTPKKTATSPSSAEATQDRCDGKIKFTWQYFDPAPDHFKIERSESEDSGYNQIGGEISGGKRFYTDENVTKNIKYYYKVTAYDGECEVYGFDSDTVMGLAPDKPAAPSNVTTTQVDVGGKPSIKIDWTDNSINETGYILKRIFASGGGERVFDLDPDVDTYTDSEVENCIEYIYEVYAKNDCATNGIKSTNTANHQINETITNTFDGVTKTLKASKGYFTNRVELSWTNNNANLINQFKIYRRVLGDTDEPILISSQNANSSLYTDNTTDAGVLYEYFIIAEGSCGNTTIYSNVDYTTADKSIGFRSPSGIINGSIAYTGGIAVEGAKILVERAAGNTGKSLLFNGSNQYVRIAHHASLMPSSEITISAWVKPSSLNSDMNIVSKETVNNGYRIFYEKASNSAVFEIAIGGTYITVKATNGLIAGEYKNITATYDGSNAKIYIDGIEKGNTSASGTISATSDPLYIGGDNGNGSFAGNIDEVLIFNIAKSAPDIKNDHSRFLSESENGLIAYYRMEADGSPFIFDASKTGSNYNANDGTIVGGATWSNDIPAGTQLGMVGITSSTGSYTVSNIRYNGVGENYTITPFFGVHQFNPGNKVLFIGDGASVHNNQDFEDISSFKVTGTVLYEDTEIVAQGIFLKIDGELVIKAGQPVMTEETDSSFHFNINVPIGEHVITLEKAGHTFSAGRFPPTGTWDFQDEKAGIEFIDNTKRKIVGRAVGGTIEAEKKPGMGLSKNNIGTTTIKIEHTGKGALDLNTSEKFVFVSTNDVTGEYSIELPPINYVVENISVKNSAIDFGAQAPIDASISMPLLTVYDTSSNGAIDSAKYHIRRDFIFREKLDFDVFNEAGTGSFLGEERFTYTNPITGDTASFSLSNDPFGFPVFQQSKIYKARIKVFEKYTNSNDLNNIVFDTVPVQDAKISIFNALASAGLSANTEEIQLTTGDTLYTFKAGAPNNAIASPVEHSYTKTFDILVEAGGNDKTWKDVRGGNLYRAFVLGQIALGSSFTTAGPEVVNHILRDPPGSNSYAYLETGTSYTTASSWEVNTNEALNLNKQIFTGAKFTVGLGVSTATEIENNIVLGTEIASSQNESGEHVETVTVTEGFATNADAFSVGAPSDLYVGRAMNMEFGLTDVISFVPESLANAANTDAYGNANSTNYRLVKKSGFFVVPGGYQTMFIYPEHHILNKLIPRLIELRNSLLDGTNANYLPVLTDASHPYFGINNDNIAWGSDKSTDTPTKTEFADHKGKSYEYKGDLTKYGIASDSVRWYNQQIGLWRAAIFKNEKAKVEAIASGNPERNISYAGGSSFTYAHASEKTETETSTWEVGLSETAQLQISGKVNNSGVGVDHSLSISVNTGKSSSSSTTNSTTYGYELSDDQDEFFSIDVYKAKDGNGPIFYTKAGESSCPYEDEIKTQFFAPGTTISKATLQREIPEISVATPKLVNVPSDQEAVFPITLTNNSASGDDMYYTLRVLASSNPNGAIVKVDGINPNQTFLIPANSSINKTLTIGKGPIEIDYDSIEVLLHSPCQYDPTNADDNIVSSVFLTAHFLPTCSPVNILGPQQNWVANNSFNDTIQVTIGDYDINYATLKNIQLQYKASTSSTWKPIGTWWKDKSDAPTPATADSIPQNIPFITFDWNIKSIVDGPYDLRSVAECTQATIYSDIHSGLIDRINPTLFGAASPADGILAPNDEIMVQFNEEIDETILTSSNFDIRGVLNGSAIRHNASIFFDGTGDHVAVDNMNFKRKSFTIEFWAKRLASNVAQTIFSQGTVDTLSLQIGFEANNKFTFRLQDETLTTDTTISDNKWHHWAVTYDIDNENAIIYLDGDDVKTSNSFVTLYDTDGDLTIGKRTYSPVQSFTGNVHGLRIWNRARSQSKIIANFLKKLSGTEGGLLANWRMDEGRGTLTEDIANARHATVNAQWKLDPQGTAFNFPNNDDYLEVKSPIALTDEHDMTIEFWFKAADGVNKTFLSNGKGDGTDSNTVGWRIGTNAQGHIMIYNNGQAFTATTTNYFDDEWHHFALVVNRIANTLAFVDGELKGSISSDDWSGFGGAKIWIGTLGWMTGTVENFDQNYNGKMDEIRIWELARKQDQIKGDMNNKLNGDEIGLRAYYPFEKYTLTLGIYTSTEVLYNETENTTDSLIIKNGATYTTVTPNIKLPRPIEKLNFIYTTNIDKIILTPTDPPSKIENVILDITVKNIKDLNNNKLQSPITWTAFVDRNQVSWEDQELEFSKELNDPLTFESKIVNTGGNIVDFQINNLPSWLSANPESGEISPSSTRKITFIVDENVNIGNYEESIMLSTAFGFDERLGLKLNVSKTPPSDWTVNAADYQYSMSIVGQISIGGVISTDPNDMLSVYVGDEIRGVANLEYIEQLDLYEVFMDVYSNSVQGETLSFRVWNASEGQIHTQVTPGITLDTFEADVAKGSPSSPVIFSTVNTVLRQLDVPEGWKWISFNLTTSDLSNVNNILSNLDASNGDEIKDMMYFDKYDTQNGWIGTISANGGFKNDKLYKLNLSNGGTLEYEGEVANPLSHSITVVSGWNWIPFVSQRNMTVSEALANLNPAEGDLIKGQRQFAIYDTSLGWVGSLKSLEPGEGYMIKVQSAATFKFPKSGLYNGRNKGIENKYPELLNEHWQLSPFSYKDNMSIVAQIDVHKNAIDATDYLGAFVGDEIRGVAKPVYNSNTKQYLYFLTLYSNQVTENITFRLIDEFESNQYDIKEIGAFQNNSVLGSIDKPVQLSLSDKNAYEQGIVVENELLKTYPNPFSNSLNVEINLKHKSHIIVEVFNTIGQRVGIIANGPFDSGIHLLEWKPENQFGKQLPKGIYKIKITSPFYTNTKSVVYR